MHTRSPLLPPCSDMPHSLQCIQGSSALAGQLRRLLQHKPCTHEHLTAASQVLLDMYGRAWAATAAAAAAASQRACLAGRDALDGTASEADQVDGCSKSHALVTIRLQSLQPWPDMQGGTGQQQQQQPLRPVSVPALHGRDALDGAAQRARPDRCQPCAHDHSNAPASHPWSDMQGGTGQHQQQQQLKPVNVPALLAGMPWMMQPSEPGQIEASTSPCTHAHSNVLASQHLHDM